MIRCWPAGRMRTLAKTWVLKASGLYHVKHGARQVACGVQLMVKPHL